jgi:ABC-type lipoprotein release transport system permease subunit
MHPLRLLVPIAWRNLWRNPRRTIITLLVVMVGMWSILVFDVMMQAWATSSREASLRLLTGEGQIHATGYLDDPGVARRLPAPDGALRAVLDSRLVAGWAARVRVPAIIQSEYRTRALTLLGVSPRSEVAVSDLPGAIVQGRYLDAATDPGLVIGRELALRLKTRIGKRVVVMAQAADGHLAEAGFVVVGLFGGSGSAQEQFAFTGLQSAQRLLAIGTDISEISFDASRSVGLDDTVAMLRHAAPASDVEPWTALVPLAYVMEQYSRTYVLIWLLIMFVLMAIGIVNTQLMAVFERTREFGLLQALGMRPGLILLQVALESALLVGVGVVAGVVLMLSTLAPFRNGLDLGVLAAGVELYGAGRILHPQLAAGDAVRFALAVWVLGTGTALWPARTAAHTAPVTAMASG